MPRTAEAVQADHLNNAGGGIIPAPAYCYWMMTAAASRSEGSQGVVRNVKYT